MHISKNCTLFLFSRVLFMEQLLEFGWNALSSRCDFQWWSNNAVRLWFFYPWYICNMSYKRPIVYRGSGLYVPFNPWSGSEHGGLNYLGALFSCSLDMRICVALSLLFRRFGLVFSFFLYVAYLFGTISSSDYISLAERVPRKDPSLDISKPENWTCSMSFQWQCKIQLKRFFFKLNI